MCAHADRQHISCVAGIVTAYVSRNDLLSEPLWYVDTAAAAKRLKEPMPKSQSADDIPKAQKKPKLSAKEKEVPSPEHGFLVQVVQ